MSEQETVTEPEKQWLVVLASDSGARLLPNQRVTLVGLPVGDGQEVLVELETSQIKIANGDNVPGKTIFAVRCDAPSLREAADVARSMSSALAVIAAFVANAAVEMPALLQALDARSGLREREYGQWYETAWYDFTRPSRTLDREEFVAVVEALHGARFNEQLLRALGQYDIALRYWSVAARPLALAHLYIASESLGDALADSHRDALGLTEEEHAQRLGVDTKRKGWKNVARARARKAYVFSNDDATYKTTLDASNGFEHGSQPSTALQEAAAQVGNVVLGYVRRSILELLPLDDPEMVRAIADRTPTDRTPLVYFAGGTLSGPAGEPWEWGLDGKALPHLQWDRVVNSADRDDSGVLNVNSTDNIKPLIAPGVTYTHRVMEVWGGLNDASRMKVERSEPRVTRGETTPPEAE